MVPVPGRGELGPIEVTEGAVDGEGGVCQVLHVAQRINGLPGPAPLALRRGVGDGLQLAQACALHKACAAWS